MPVTPFEPQAEITISTPEQLKAVSGALRLEVMEAVLTEARTVKQVADLLGHPPTKLYYHMNALEKAGFVTVVETRVKSGIIEKYYRTTAKNIRVDRQLLHSKGKTKDLDTFESVLGLVLEGTADELRRSRAAGLIRLTNEETGEAPNTFLARAVLNLPAAALPKAMAKLKALADEFKYAEKPDDLNYGLTIAFYPRVSVPKTKKKGKTK